MIISIFFSLIVVTNMTLQMAVPHVLWNPFIWGRRSYPIYLANDIADSLGGVSLDDDDDGRVGHGATAIFDDRTGGPPPPAVGDALSYSNERHDREDGIAGSGSSSSTSTTGDNISLLRGIGNGNSGGNNDSDNNRRTTPAATSTEAPSPPLCLSEKQWNELSSGKLSSLNPDDVATVKRGLRYLRNESGGLIVNALAQNVADSIRALRHNMDGLASLFRRYDNNDGQGNSSSGSADAGMRLSLVVFECGSRFYYSR
jgi:hypothetical protein